MPIISGFTGPTVDGVKPFELPVDDMAKGLMARQGRADEARNNFLVGDASLDIKTRDQQEDYDLAQSLRSSYRQGINNLADSAGGDWSKIDKSQIQALAIDHVNSDEFRLLTTAKTNNDAFLESQRKARIDAKHGDPLLFGELNPTTASLYLGIGKDKKMRDFQPWNLQGHMDWHGKIEALYSGLGHELKETLGWKEGDGDFYKWWKKWKKSNYWNTDRIATVKNNIYENYITTAEGKQHHSWMTQEFAKNKGLEGVVLEEAVKNHIQAFITTIGDKQEIVEEKYDETLKTLNIPQEPRPRGGSRGGSGGGGSDEEPPIINPKADPVGVTSPGLDWNHTTPTEAANDITTPNVEITDKNLKATDMGNIHAVEMKMTSVGLVSGDPSDIVTGERRIMGTFQNLDETMMNTDTWSGTNNRSIFKIGNDDFSIIKPDEYLEAARETMGSSQLQILKKQAGSRDFNPWRSMFKTSQVNNQFSIELDPTLLKARDILKAKYEANPTDEALGRRYRAMEDHVDNAMQFQKDHAGSISEVKAHYEALNNKAFHLKRMDGEIQESVGLTAAHKEQVQKKWKNSGMSGKYSQMAASQYDLAMGKAYEAAGFFGMDELTQYQTDDDDDKQKMLSVLNDTVDDLMRHRLNPLDFDQYADEILANNMPGANDDPSTPMNWVTGNYMGKYIEDKLKEAGIEYNHKSIGSREFLMGDDDKKGEKHFQHTYRAMIDNLSKHFGHYDKGSKKITYRKTRGEYANEFDTKRRSELKNIDRRYVDYYDKLEEVKNEFQYTGQLFMITKDLAKNDYQRKHLGDVLTNAFAGDTDAIKMLRRVQWGSAAGGMGADEVFSKDLLVEEIKKQYDAQGGEKKMSFTEFKDDFLRKAVKGIRFDRNNEQVPFNIDFSVDFTGTGGMGDDDRPMPVRFEMQYTPSESELTLMGYSPLLSKYFGQIREGVAKSDKMYFDLNAEGANGKSTRFFVAPYNIGESIKKGQYYTIGDGDPANQYDNKVLNPVKSDVGAIELHLARAYPNQAAITKLTNAYAAIQRGESPETHGFPKGTTPAHLLQLMEKIQGTTEPEVKTFDSGTVASKDRRSGKWSIPGVVKDDMVTNTKNITPQMALDIYSIYNPKTLENSDGSAREFYDETRGGKIHTYPKVDDTKDMDIKKYGMWSTHAPNNVYTNFKTNISGFISDINDWRGPNGHTAVTEWKTAPILIVSGRRSLQQNISAYRGGLAGDANHNKLSNSAHLRGEAIDIRTEDHGDNTHLGGENLWKFALTEEGQELLDKHGLRIIKHKVKGGGMHLDIAPQNSRQRRDGILVEDQSGGGKSTYKDLTIR